MSEETRFKPRLGRLDEIGKILNVCDEIKAQPRVLEMISTSPYNRRLLKKYDVELCLNQNADGKDSVDFKPYRIYLFSDLLIVAADQMSARGSIKTVDGEAMVTMDEDYLHKDSINNELISDSISEDSSSSSAKFKKRYKISMWMDIGNLQYIKENRGKLVGWRFSHATRKYSLVNGAECLSVKVQSKVVWSGNKDFVTKFMDKLKEVTLDLTILVRKLEEEHGIDGTKTMNGTMAAKAAISRSSANKYANNPRRGLAGKDDGTKTVQLSNGTMSIRKGRDRIHSKWGTLKGDDKDKVQQMAHEHKANAKPKEMLLDPGLEAVYTVDFSEGPMGFALGSDEEIGVYVARVAAKGMADTALISAGDRIVSVNDKRISKDTSWKVVLKFLETRPLQIVFARNEAVDKEARRREEKEISEWERAIAEREKVLKEQERKQAELERRQLEQEKDELLFEQEENKYSKDDDDDNTSVIMDDDVEETMIKRKKTKRRKASRPKSRSKSGSEDKKTGKGKDSFTSVKTGKGKDSFTSVATGAKDSFTSQQSQLTVDGNNKNGGIQVIKKKKKRAYQQKRQQKKQWGGPQTLAEHRQHRLDPDALGRRERQISEWFKKVTDATKNEHERQMIYQLREIYYTEIDYVNALLCAEQFRQRFRKAKVTVMCKDEPKKGFNKLFCKHNHVASMCKQESAKKQPLMTEGDIRQLLMNSSEIIEFNKALLKEIEAGITKLMKDESRWSAADLVIEYAPAFQAVIPYFQIYSFYAAQYPRALGRLAELQENPEFVNVLTTREAREGITLKDLLIKPVQRLTKYHLLYGNLIKFMEKYVEQLAVKDDSGKMQIMDKSLSAIKKLNEMVDDAQKTYKIIEKVSFDVNGKVGNQQRLEDTIKIVNDMGGAREMDFLLTPTRKYMEEFEVSYQYSRGPKKSPTHLYLFNDLIVMATEKKSLLDKGEVIDRLKSTRFRSGRRTLNTTGGSTRSLRSSVKRTTSRMSRKSSMSSPTSPKKQTRFSHGVPKAKLKVRYHMRLQSLADFQKVEFHDEDDMFSFKFTESKPIESADPAQLLESMDFFQHEFFCATEFERDTLMQKLQDAKFELLRAVEETKAAKSKVIQSQKKANRTLSRPTTKPISASA